MSACVSVLTGKGYSAIGSIGLKGEDAGRLLSQVFTAGGKSAGDFAAGRIYHGTICDGGRMLDQVVVGCEADNCFVVHCHGNPILIQAIAQLFTQHGAELVDTETFYQQSISNATWAKPTLQMEAAIEQCKAATLEGVAIIQAQLQAGLAAWIQHTQDNIDGLSVDEIHTQCRQILCDSVTARRIIHGVKVVLAGPPNSGKSTLLNALAGSEKAIVSDTAGTTRDWVSAAVKLGSLRVELIDTAGLGENALREKPDKAAQDLTRKLLTDCDGILCIQDATAPVSMALPDHIPVITVFNKADLLKPDPVQFENAILISAKTGYNIDKIQQALVRGFGAEQFDKSRPVAFTDRQRRIIEQIGSCSAKQEIQNLLCELSGGN